MKDLLKYEIRKQRNRKFVIIVGVAVIAFYIVMGMLGNISLYGPWDANYFLTHEEQRKAEKSMQHGVIDETYIANFEKDYRKFIDKHRLSDEEIAKNLKKDNERVEIEDILYDWDYGYYVLSNEDFNGSEMLMLDDTYVLIQYSKNPLSVMTNYNRADEYSETLGADYLKCAKEHMENMDIVAGYHYGWDILVSINSQLPYTLGILIIVCFFAIFGAERETGMKTLIQVSKYGRRKTVTTKLIYAWGLTTVLWFAFQIIALIGTAIVYGLEGGDCTVYWELYPCPYGLTYIQYYLLQSVISYMGTLVFMLLVCILSSLFRSRLSLMVGMGIVLATAFPITQFTNSEPAFDVLQKIKVLTPTQLMGAFNTFQIYQGYAFGKVVIRLPEITAIALVVELLVFLFIIYKRETK